MIRRLLTLLCFASLMGCTTSLSTPEPLPSASVTVKSTVSGNSPTAFNPTVAPSPATTGATVTGRVILGYGDHSPVDGLPLWIGTGSQGEPATHTDVNGKFTLADLPTGKIQIVDNHLTFQVLITSPQVSIDLGLLKYPLIHLPDYYYWTPVPLPSLSALLDNGERVEFSVCLTHLDWQRPTEQMQKQVVWSKPPFSDYSKEHLRWWFERSAVIYNAVDRFSQSFPDGPNLDHLGADWRYLLGLWTGPDIISHSECEYNGQSLEDLLAYRQIEIWLIGYEATLVQRLGKDFVGYDESSLCDSKERSCTERLGDHFAVHVVPIEGYQVIRFPGVEGTLAVHLVENRQELLELPEQFP